MIKNICSYLLIIVSVCSVIFLTGCGEPEEPVETIFISPDFELIGKWYFLSVYGSGTIFGVPRESTDDNPSGYVEFLPDGKGYSDFKVNLLDMPFELQDSIVWTRLALDTVLVQAVTEGKMDLWSLKMATNDSISAVWPINVAGNSATLRAEFIK